MCALRARLILRTAHLHRFKNFRTQYSNQVSNEMGCPLQTPSKHKCMITLRLAVAQPQLRYSTYFCPADSKSHTIPESVHWPTQFLHNVDKTLGFGETSSDYRIALFYEGIHFELMRTASTHTCVRTIPSHNKGTCFSVDLDAGRI